MESSLLRRLLNIQSHDWEFSPPEVKYRLVLYKAAVLISISAIAFALLATATSPESSIIAFYLQGTGLMCMVPLYFLINRGKRLKSGAATLISCGLILITSLILSSRSGDASGAYHIVPSIVFLTMLLVGDKPAILISAVYSIFYLTVALDLFTLIEIPRIVPVRRQIYVDRVIELVLITGGSYVYHKVFIIQKAALREHERIAAERHSLQSVSHLADGVAHEINNPLSIIWMTTQRLSDRNWVLADGKASLEKIMDASQRIGQFVHCIQMLTTPRVGSVEVVNIGILVNSAFDRSLAALPSLRNPRLKPDIAGDVMIRCHEESLRTVLIEIFTNAIEAAHLVTEPQIEVGLTREKRHWHLTIADNGVEFDHSLMDSFVRPFYTTKFDRPRRGLGLTTSQFLLARMSWGLRFERRQGLTIASVTIPDVDVTVTAENKRVA